MQGPRNVFVTRRNDNYFADMVQWNNRSSYVPAIDLVAQSGCGTVGIDISQNQLEYPFQALLLQHNRQVRFVHTGVDNASVRYAPATAPPVCAVFCPDCAHVQKKEALYRNMGPPAVFDHILVYLPPPAHR